MKRALVLFALAAACDGRTLPPTGQVVLYVTTDAVLPPPPGTLATSAPVPMFDRAVIEIFPPGATTPCVDCAREVSLDTALVDEGRASMGYVPAPRTTGHRARVRLYRTAGAEIVAPRASSTLESVVLLPPVSDEGIVEVTVRLDTDSLGAPRGTLDAPIDPLPGKPPKGLVGSWHSDLRRPCTGAGEGQVCFPGGAYWVGRPAVAYPSPDQKRAIERLAVVSPFVLDAHEATVKELRDSGVWDESGPGRKAADPSCTFADFPGPQDDLVVDCLSKQHATAYCESRGMRLPTEVEWEYAATVLGRYELYPWGDDDPKCGDAIFGRSLTGSATNPSLTQSKACAPAAGVAKPGSGTRDRYTVPGSGEIVDLVGNVAEWVSDEYQDEWESCWTQPILVDFRCATPTAGPPHLDIRGAAFGWDALVLDVKTRTRAPADPASNDESAGVRCARASD